jgi:hypothetical protein
VNPRRRSNSSGFTAGAKEFKTKFDINEQEPVFEESMHGPTEEDDAEPAKDGEKIRDLSKTDTSSSTDSNVDEAAKDE